MDAHGASIRRVVCNGRQPALTRNRGSRRSFWKLHDAVIGSKTARLAAEIKCSAKTPTEVASASRGISIANELAATKGWLGDRMRLYAFCGLELGGAHPASISRLPSTWPAATMRPLSRLKRSPAVPRIPSSSDLHGDSSSYSNRSPAGPSLGREWLYFTHWPERQVGDQRHFGIYPHFPFRTAPGLLASYRWHFKQQLAVDLQDHIAFQFSLGQLAVGGIMAKPDRSAPVP